MSVGMFTWFGYESGANELMKAIRVAGFDNVLIWGGKDTEDLLPIHVAAARREGLYIENAHLSFGSANALWMDSEVADIVVNEYVDSIKLCSSYNIPAVVLHLTSSERPEGGPNVAGLERLWMLTELCEHTGVTLMLENLRHIDFLDYVYENIKSDALGFCYDSGHAFCFGYEDDMAERYGAGRSMCTHINDNDGEEDQHRIPGDGKIDWPTTMRRLADSGYEGSLAIEVNRIGDSVNGKLSMEEYLAKAVERARRLDTMFNYFRSIKNIEK